MRTLQQRQISKNISQIVRSALRYSGNLVSYLLSEKWSSSNLHVLIGEKSHSCCYRRVSSKRQKLNSQLIEHSKCIEREKERYIYICVCACVRACVYIYIYIYICVCVCACVYIYTDTHTRTHAHTRTYIYEMSTNMLTQRKIEKTLILGYS